MTGSFGPPGRGSLYAIVQVVGGSPRGVGIGLRPEFLSDLLACSGVADFGEVVAESCFADPAARRQARALAEVWPLVLHGVKLSLGSASGFDDDKARRLGSLARELRSPVISEHVAMTSAGGLEVGHLTAVPFTRAAVRAIARNVTAARRYLPDVPLLLENIAWSLRFDEDEMDEGDFHAEVLQVTGCGLLLDVANLYANARNAGRSPSELLRRYPLEKVAMMHVAGGRLEQGFWADTHADAVPEAVFQLVAEALGRTGPVPIVLERDASFPAFADLAAELARLRALVAAVPECVRESRAPVPAGAFGAGNSSVTNSAFDRAFSERQALLARLLVAAEGPSAADAEAFGREALLRTRAILLHKRVDDAFPLLPRSAPHSEELRRLALSCVSKTPRAPRRAGVADALAIAEEACRERALAPAARIDRLLLRTRFIARGPGESPTPRAAPFVGRAPRPEGGNVWAIKGPGAEAPVRVWETREGGMWR